MNGSISGCLAQLVREVFGATSWNEIVDRAERIAHPQQLLYIARSEVDDVESLALIDATCAVLGLSLAEIADLVGEYWCCIYAPEVHDVSWSRIGSARECIEVLDQVSTHLTTSNLDIAAPRSHGDWKDDKTMHLQYRSDRGLIDFYVGLVKGIGTALGEPMRVTKVTSSAVEVVFA